MSDPIVLSLLCYAKWAVLISSDIPRNTLFGYLTPVMYPVFYLTPVMYPVFSLTPVMLIPHEYMTLYSAT